MRKTKKQLDLLGYTVEELRDLVQQGLASGPSNRLSMDEVRAEARRRFIETTKGRFSMEG
jgi:antitoxin ParD1/3/4